MADGGGAAAAAPKPPPFQLQASVVVGSTAASCGKESLSQAGDQLAAAARTIDQTLRNAAGNAVREGLRAKQGKLKGRSVSQPSTNIRNPFGIRVQAQARIGSTLPATVPPSTIAAGISKIRIPPNVGARLLRGGLRGGIFSGLVEAAFQLGTGKFDAGALGKAVAGGVIAALLLAPFGLVGISAILLGILVGVIVSAILDALFPTGMPAPAPAMGR